MTVKVCPFCKCGGCASHATEFSAWENYPCAFRVECSVCSAKGPTKNTEREAIETWNNAKR